MYIYIKFIVNNISYFSFMYFEEIINALPISFQFLTRAYCGHCGNINNNNNSNIVIIELQGGKTLNSPNGIGGTNTPLLEHLVL
jgi:hypothetical protein